MYCLKDYCFRTIEKKDIEWVRILHNSPEVLFMLTDTNFINEKQQEIWFEKISLSKTSKRFIIEYNNKKIGVIRLDDIDLLNKSICVGLDINKNFRRKGHGLNSFNVLLKYCFEELNMNRIWLLVADFNTKAFNLYKKLGFIEEGRQRERLYRNGEYHDYIMIYWLNK